MAFPNSIYGRFPLYQLPSRGVRLFVCIRLFVEAVLSTYATPSDVACIVIRRWVYVVPATAALFQPKSFGNILEIAMPMEGVLVAVQSLNKSLHV